MTPPRTDAPLASIIVGQRRRQAMGDLTGLARSIAKHGLLHPVVIDDVGHLVAGGRRLAACEQLGWERIPVTRLADLTEKQLREIELEENLQRKDLTAYERSVTVVQLRKAAKAAMAEETCADSAQVSKRKRGPARKPGSTRDLATRTGVKDTTAREAETHVALAEKYPVLQQSTFKQSHVMAVAEAMAPLPEKDRDLAMELVTGATNDPKIVIDVVQNVAAMPEVERKEVARLWASDDKRERSRAVTLAAKKPPMPDPRLSILKEAITLVKRCGSLFPNDPEVPAMNAVVTDLRAIQEAINSR